MTETTDLAVRRPATVIDIPDRASLADTMEVVRAISQTEFVPKTIRGNNAAILACVLYGREIGLGPMESLKHVNMIEGRPSLSAEAKVKRARQSGHDIWGEVDDTRAVVQGKRGDNGREMTVEFTYAEATAAGLTTKQNWKHWRQDMLWARAVSRLCRRLFTDDSALATLDPDEAEYAAEAEKVESITDLPHVDAVAEAEELIEEGKAEWVEPKQDAFPIPESARA